MTDDRQAPMEGDGPADAAAYHGRVERDGPTPTSGEPKFTGGVYMVLWASLDATGARAVSFEEVGYYRGAAKEGSKGGQAMTAKRNAFLDPENPRLRTAAEGAGVVLRAVPAQSWPPEVKPTRYTRPAPTLEIH